MTLGGVIKMMINKLTGKDSSSAVTEAENRIALWRQIYKGTPDWLEYSYPTLAGKKEKRIRKSLNAGYMAVSELTGLIWSERPELTVDKFTQSVLDDNAFIKNMIRETEYFLALGGMALKLYVKDEKIGISFVQADSFIPVSSDSTGIQEADILDRRVINNKQYLRIEKHRKDQDGSYTIKSEVFEETGSQLVPASLSLFGIEEEEAQSPVRLFHYIGVPGGNNKDTTSPLGLSLFANCKDTIESLDIAFDALQSEIVLGRKRIIVPAGCLRQVIDPTTGKPANYFDPSDEIFQAFAGDDKEQLKITDNTVELRIDEIRLAIQTLLDILCIQIGVNVGTFSFTGTSMKTATEVISENSKTFKTKQFYEGAIGDGIVEMCNAIQELGRYIGEPVGAEIPAIKWDDSVIEDRNSKTAYYQSRLTGGTIERWRAIKELDGVTEEEAQKRAEAIKAQMATIGVDSLLGGF
jgi:A118 family predicted phage portal protein